MSTNTASRRRDRRYSLALVDSCRVVFDYPYPDGENWRATLLELSVAGLRLAFDDRMPDIKAGTKLVGVFVQIGDCEMQGNILIRHLDVDSGNRTLVGGMFYPATDLDQLKLMSVLAGIEAVQSELRER